MKTILVATDFLPTSQNCLRNVVDLIIDSRRAVRILLLNTYTMPMTQDPQKLLHFNDELKTLSKINLERQRWEALEWIRNPNIKIVTASHMGSLPNVISNLVKLEKIDLVAMGKDEGKLIKQVSETLEDTKCSLLITYDN